MLKTTSLVILALTLVIVLACEPDNMQYGCKMMETTCSCGMGCRNDYVYKTRRACLTALREMSSNACMRSPCMRGICTQTIQDPGFACKCEGTGFYGQRCGQACPTTAERGVIFPHECIVI